MGHLTDKESHLLASLHNNSGGIFAWSVGGTARRVIFLTALVGTLLASVTLTQRFLAKVHLRSIGGKMRAKLDALIQHLPHLGPQEFEAYINKTVDGLPLRQIEGHLRVCHVCKEEVEIVQQAIRDFESHEIGDVPGPEETRATKSFQWSEDATLWIDDEAYRLRPAGDTKTRALVEGLTSSDLKKMTEEDARVPGAHLVSVEDHGVEVIAPLSRFAMREVASAADGSAQQTLNPVLDSRPAEVFPSTLAHMGEHLIIEMFVDGRGAVFLHASVSAA